MLKNSKSITKSKKIRFCHKKKQILILCGKNPILLVLLFWEISHPPELTCPPHFRIQRGYPKRYGQSLNAWTEPI